MYQEEPFCRRSNDERLETLQLSPVFEALALFHGCNENDILRLALNILNELLIKPEQFYCYQVHN